MPFSYARDRLERKHGPRGYEDCDSYKPWLRDEFDYRCIYCLCRETWSANGQAEFSVDHVLPVSIAPSAAVLYENMVYACSLCNASRQNQHLPFHPGEQPLAEHLDLTDNGIVTGLTTAGSELIDRCHLNRTRLVEFRRQMLRMVAYLKAQTSNEARALLHELLRFPTDLPNLRNLKPPAGNARPEGIAESYYERQQRGELPDTY
ncbi:MAG: hypothetical protein JNM56_25675 [Planctomycetia bacterium]|nr:hypothetical protein [Planctomycetia bacterium]